MIYSRRTEIPNHVTNKIIMHKDQKEILEFVKSENSDFDFNNFIKMPDSLDIESSGQTDYAFIFGMTNNLKYASAFSHPLKHKPIMNVIDTFYSWDEMIIKVKNHYDSIKDDQEKLDKFLELSKATVTNWKQYGVLTWYDWAPKNWGTKWNAYEVSVDAKNNYIKFDTAWSDPKPILELFVEKFKFSGRIKSFDEGGWFWYDRLYENGVLVEDHFKRQEDYNKLCIELKGWDPDEDDDE